MIRFLISFALILTFSGVPRAATAQDTPLRGVVELFTSQGCSSCPPADDILADYARDPSTLALSWHVDYWNYLGWKDTFSSASATKRQHAYAQAFARRGVYTPQAVVNGRNHAVGSRKNDIEKLLSGGVAPLTAKINVTRSVDAVKIACGNNITNENATLSVVYFTKSATISIERGENRNRTVTYHNVVRAMDMVGMVKDGALQTTLPLNALQERARELGASHAALLLQKPGTDGAAGPILGAAKLGAL